MRCHCASASPSADCTCPNTHWHMSYTRSGACVCVLCQRKRPCNACHDTRSSCAGEGGLTDRSWRSANIDLGLECRSVGGSAWPAQLLKAPRMELSSEHARSTLIGFSLSSLTSCAVAPRRFQAARLGLGSAVENPILRN
eukprot:5607844-Alexandrium_andersonii.AAC.1